MAIAVATMMETEMEMLTVMTMSSTIVFVYVVILSFFLHNAAGQIYIMIMNIKPCDEPPTQEGWGIRIMQADCSVV